MTIVSHQSAYYAGTGGEFTLAPNGPLGALLGQTGPFETSCFERTEAMTSGASHDVQLNTEAVRGGRNDGAPGPGGGAPLDPRTACLYTQSAARTPAGYDYTPRAGRSGSAQALQEVIRYLENEAAKTRSAGSVQGIFYADARQAVAAGRWTGLSQECGRTSTRRATAATSNIRRRTCLV
jgi:hypothetical protein